MVDRGCLPEPKIHRSCSIAFDCPIGCCAAVLALVAWMALAAAGFLVLEAHERTPARGIARRRDWPEGTALGFVPGLPNVLMAVHPRCPCTRASLEGLADVVRRSPGAASVRLLVFRPEGAAEDWAGAPCSRAIAEVPGATRVDDPGGVEAARFGLMTSGAVAAFDAAGRSRFSGGLTGGRGLSGRSAGGEAVLEILEGRVPVAGGGARLRLRAGPALGAAGAGGHSMTDLGRDPGVVDRAKALFADQVRVNARWTDRFFAGLLLVQWAAAVGVALWLSPRRLGRGREPRPPPRLGRAAASGGVIALPAALGLLRARPALDPVRRWRSARCSWARC